MLSCYNRGCGQDFDPANNQDGELFFAYYFKTISSNSLFFIETFGISENFHSSTTSFTHLGYVTLFTSIECSRNTEIRHSTKIQHSKRFVSANFVSLDSCRHHPGVPFFHDAYKGWSCCNKKSVDFTEFLNIKGCQLSKHSNVKPVEPEKPAKVVDEIDEEPIKIPEPVKPSALVRPSFDLALTTLKPTIAPALKQSIDNLVVNDTKKATTNSSK